MHLLGFVFLWLSRRLDLMLVQTQECVFYGIKQMKNDTAPQVHGTKYSSLNDIFVFLLCCHVKMFAVVNFTMYFKICLILCL